MTFIDMFATAYEHFATVKNSKTDEMAILIRYAKEELKLDDSQIPGYIIHADFSNITADNYKSHGDFFAWYYMNYLTEIKGAIIYDIRILHYPDGDFTAIGVQPQKMVFEHGQRKPVPCHHDEAEFYSVYYQTLLGIRDYVAHARTYESAKNFCGFLKSFAYKWLK